MTWKYFKIEEFKCKCGCGTNAIDPSFVDDLDVLRAMYGHPIHITSGYRCPDYNDRISSTGRTGPHTTGRAADISVAGTQAWCLLDAIFEQGAMTGIGINQKGNGRFIHVDNLTKEPRPNVWSY